MRGAGEPSTVPYSDAIDWSNVAPSANSFGSAVGPGEVLVMIPSGPSSKVIGGMPRRWRSFCTVEVRPPSLTFWNHGYELRLTRPTSSRREVAGNVTFRHASTKVARASGVELRWYFAVVHVFCAHVLAFGALEGFADEVPCTPTTPAAATKATSAATCRAPKRLCELNGPSRRRWRKSQTSPRWRPG